MSSIEYRILVRCTGYSDDPYLPTEGIAHQLGGPTYAFAPKVSDLIGSRHGWDGEHSIVEAWVEQRIIGDWQPLTTETPSAKVES